MDRERDGCMEGQREGEGLEGVRETETERGTRRERKTQRQTQRQGVEVGEWRYRETKNSSEKL